MRLSKQKLPKMPAKHSAAGNSKYRRNSKVSSSAKISANPSTNTSMKIIEAESKMNIDSDPPLDEAERLKLKLERKRKNLHKIAYKKINFSRTNKKGHRAV